MKADIATELPDSRNQSYEYQMSQCNGKVLPTCLLQEHKSLGVWGRWQAQQQVSWDQPPPARNGVARRQVS